MPVVIDAVVRWLVVAAAGSAGVVALTHWMVRAGHLQPFGAWPRALRKVSDPVVVPIERRLLRAGGNPQSAPYWLLAGAVGGGLVLISLVRWLVGFVYSLGHLAQSGPRAWVATLVSWAFSILMFAILARVISTWFGMSPYSRWIRPAYLLTDWIIEPLRRTIPSFGPLDVSPMVAYLILLVVRNVVLGAL